MRNLHNVLVRKIADKKIWEYGHEFFQGTLIDIGCGEKPYAVAFEGLVDKHIGVDHKDSFHDLSQVDLLGTAYEIPVEDATFDCALCTAVLEHLE